MKGRVTFGLLCAAALAFACGPHASTGDYAGAIRTSRTLRARSSAPNGPALLSRLDVVVKNGVAMDFRVMNSGTKRLEVNFPSGQTHEVVVVDSLGREVRSEARR